MAFIYAPCRTSPLTFGCVHDPDSKVYYSFRYRAPAWSANEEKLEAAGLDEIGDVVRPSTANGFYYEAISGGVTDSSEPTWSTTKDGQTIDGSVIWKSIPDDMFLKDSDSISSSIWECDTVGVTLDNDGSTGYDTYVRVTAVPVDVTSFILRNVVTITRADGKQEEFNRSIKVKIKEQ